MPVLCPGITESHSLLSLGGATYKRMRQIEVERVKVLNDIYNLSASQDLDKLHTAVRRLAALERSAPIQS